MTKLPMSSPEGLISEKEPRALFFEIPGLPDDVTIYLMNEDVDWGDNMNAAGSHEFKRTHDLFELDVRLRDGEEFKICVTLRKFDPNRYPSLSVTRSMTYEESTRLYEANPVQADYEYRQSVESALKNAGFIIAGEDTAIWPQEEGTNRLADRLWLLMPKLEVQGWGENNIWPKREKAISNF